MNVFNYVIVLRCFIVTCDFHPVHLNARRPFERLFFNWYSWNSQRFTCEQNTRAGAFHFFMIETHSKLKQWKFTFSPFWLQTIRHDSELLLIYPCNGHRYKLYACTYVYLNCKMFIWRPREYFSNYMIIPSVQFNLQLS